MSVCSYPECPIPAVWRRKNLMVSGLLEGICDFHHDWEPIEIEVEDGSRDEPESHIAGVQSYTYQKMASLYSTYECLGCGALVMDQNQHDLFHQKTRSVV